MAYNYFNFNGDYPLLEPGAPMLSEDRINRIMIVEHIDEGVPISLTVKRNHIQDPSGEGPDFIRRLKTPDDNNWPRVYENNIKDFLGDRLEALLKKVDAHVMVLHARVIDGELGEVNHVPPGDNSLVMTQGIDLQAKNMSDPKPVEPGPTHHFASKLGLDTPQTMAPIPPDFQRALKEGDMERCADWRDRVRQAPVYYAGPNYVPDVFAVLARWKKSNKNEQHVIWRLQ